MTAVTAEPILIDDDGPVRTITLNRPQARNAIDIPLRLALAEAFALAAEDASVRAVVLTGAGSAFCSGGDISTMHRMDLSSASQRIQLAQNVIRAIWKFAKPVLAAVEGSAFGAGVALAAACDRVIAAADARFATAFLNIGLSGDMGTFFSLPARIGVARTRQLLLMGETISATRAYEWGLVDELAEKGAALTRAMTDAHLLAARPGAALSAIKHMLATAPTLDRFEVLDQEADQQANLFDSNDFAEGTAAFRAKRAPRFPAAPPPLPGVSR